MNIINSFKSALSDSLASNMAKSFMVRDINCSSLFIMVEAFIEVVLFITMVRQLGSD